MASQHPSLSFWNAVACILLTLAMWAAMVWAFGGRTPQCDAASKPGPMIAGAVLLYGCPPSKDAR